MTFKYSYQIQLTNIVVIISQITSCLKQKNPVVLLQGFLFLNTKIPVNN